jgi:hypothetical protein
MNCIICKYKNHDTQQYGNQKYFFESFTKFADNLSHMGHKNEYPETRTSEYLDLNVECITPPRLSEISMKNWNSKVKPFLISIYDTKPY